MENIEKVDQSVLAEDVSSKIPYVFLDFFLVKPLDPIKVTKEFSKPVAKNEPTTDENGIVAQDYDEVETEVKEVNSDYRKGIVLKRPMFLDDPNRNKENSLPDIKIGDTVVFRDGSGMNFDLLKDSKLLRMYDILGIEQ
jgi:co-chaperonin GroES (HSP10)